VCVPKIVEFYRGQVFGTIIGLRISYKKIKEEF